MKKVWIINDSETIKVFSTAEKAYNYLLKLILQEDNDYSVALVNPSIEERYNNLKTAIEDLYTYQCIWGEVALSSCIIDEDVTFPPHLD